MSTSAIVDDSSTTLEMTEPISPLLEGICILRVGAWRLGVAGRHCLGLQEVASAAPVPESPAHVLGVTYHESRVIPVLDLGLALEISRGCRGDPLAVGLVVEEDGTASVLAADEVVTFENLDLRQLREIEASEPASFRRFGWGRLRHGGHDVVVLEIAPLLEAVRLGDGGETGAGREGTTTREGADMETCAIIDLPSATLLRRLAATILGGPRQTPAASATAADLDEHELRSLVAEVARLPTLRVGLVVRRDGRVEFRFGERLKKNIPEVTTALIGLTRASASAAEWLGQTDPDQLVLQSDDGMILIQRDGDRLVVLVLADPRVLGKARYALARMRRRSDRRAPPPSLDHSRGRPSC